MREGSRGQSFYFSTSLFRGFCCLGGKGTAKANGLKTISDRLHVTRRTLFDTDTPPPHHLAISKSFATFYGTDVLASRRSVLCIADTALD